MIANNKIQILPIKTAIWLLVAVLYVLNASVRFAYTETGQWFAFEIGHARI
jgi:hypothetical protein